MQGCEEMEGKTMGPSAVNEPFLGGDGDACKNVAKEDDELLLNTTDSMPPTCARNTLEVISFKELPPNTDTSIMPSAPNLFVVAACPLPQPCVSKGNVGLLVWCEE